MFGMSNEKKIKEKISDISQEIALKIDELKELRVKQKELLGKIEAITNNDDDFSNFYNSVNKVRNDEYEITRATDDDFSDPKLKDSALSTLNEFDQELKNDEQEFDEDEAKVEILERKDMELEKDLEKTTQRIIALEREIVELEEKSEELTKKLEQQFET